MTLFFMLLPASGRDRNLSLSMLWPWFKTLYRVHGLGSLQIVPVTLQPLNLLVVAVLSPYPVSGHFYQKAPEKE